MLVSLGISLILAQIDLQYVESYLYDLRVRSKVINTTTSNIELVYVTPDTIQKLTGFPGAASQGTLISKILAAGPKAIVLDYDLQSAAGSEADKKALENLIASNSSIFVAGKSTPFKGEESELFLKAPFEKIRLTPSPRTTDSVNFAKDGVTRRMLLTYQGRKMLSLQLAELYNPEIKSLNAIRGRFEFYGTDQAYVDFNKAGSYPSTAFENVLGENFDPSQYKDKIVFVGTDLNLDPDDYISSPFDRKVTAMTRIEYQANSIDTLIKNSAPVKVSTYVNWFFIFLASILTLHVVLNLKPTKGLLILVSTLAGFILFCTMAYWAFRLWLPMSGPLLSIFLCYYFFIPYRLIIENRRSWEYYQKNKLLSQVEELKTNFISMMSHDLKTPIARIQGMSDVIIADGNPLSSQQREAVDTIKHSSDDLLKFITAILNYGKIESQGVQLHLQSRDINNLLQEVIRKHEFLAKVKRIQIVSELEPMFPVPVDAELMKQVFSNLVENAIKYSPEDTKIMVSSEESATKVVVQVADQGPGIPQDELANVFMKFFRSKNAKSSPIKGSGLGLYLAKYFTELHHGTIIVESSHGQGATFTVELPMEQGGSHA
ncbi:histidine kinase [Bdellovibrio bacteriovorus]|uniref:histidine kinase n=1 Tax=Bdellovibrio bacteriovorus TaxID=959 RepID=A0A150WSU5_BDEBC|nr:histidine kinase [Bdellovibrio bacteriovorus]